MPEYRKVLRPEAAQLIKDLTSDQLWCAWAFVQGHTHAMGWCSCGCRIPGAVAYGPEWEAHLVEALAFEAAPPLDPPGV